MIYRNRNDDRLWHFCQNCAAWPRENYREQTIEPPRDELCAECTDRIEQLKCEVVPEPGIA